MPNLSDEIIFDILLRLPVISLCKFRCVSKSWRSLISHPHFIRTHLSRNLDNKSEHLVLCDKDSLYSVDIESSRFGDEVHLKFPIQLNLDLDCEEICGSCDGLILIGCMGVDERIHYTLVNPSTRESRKLPLSPFALDPWCFNDYGFGYDSQSDDYKIVSISHYEPPSVENVVSVYSLKTNSWKMIENSPFDHSNIGHKSGVLVSGALHWLALTSTSEVIVALDLADEKFRTVPLPDCMGDDSDELTVLGGCLCLFSKEYHNCHVDVWVMKEYSVSDSWTKFTVTFVDFRDSWKPLSSSRTGQVMFNVNCKKLVLFDPQKKESKELVVHGLPADFEAGTYVESLVSPNWQC